MRDQVKRAGSVFLDLTGAALDMDIPDATHVFFHQNDNTNNINNYRSWDRSSSDCLKMTDGPSTTTRTRTNTSSYSSFEHSPSNHSLIDAMNCAFITGDDVNEADSMACGHGDDGDHVGSQYHRPTGQRADPATLPRTDNSSRGVARDSWRPPISSNGYDSHRGTSTEGYSTNRIQHESFQSRSSSSGTPLSSGSTGTAAAAPDWKVLSEQERSNNFDDAIQRLRRSSSSFSPIVPSTSMGRHRSVNRHVSDLSQSQHTSASNREGPAGTGSIVFGEQQRWVHSTTFPDKNNVARKSAPMMTTIGQDEFDHDNLPCQRSRHMSMCGRFSSTNTSNDNQMNTFSSSTTKETTRRHQTTQESLMSIRPSHSEAAYHHHHNNIRNNNDYNDGSRGYTFNHHSQTLSSGYNRNQNHDPRRPSRFTPSERQEIHWVPPHSPQKHQMPMASPIAPRYIRDRMHSSSTNCREHYNNDVVHCVVQTGIHLPLQAHEHQHFVAQSPATNVRSTDSMPQHHSQRQQQQFFHSSSSSSSINSRTVTPPPEQYHGGQTMGDGQFVTGNSCSNNNNNNNNNEHSTLPTITSDPFAGMTAIEIAPGEIVPYLGVGHILDVMATGDFDATTCIACGGQLNCSNEGHYILCPDCHTVSPIYSTKKRPPQPRKCCVLGFKLIIPKRRKGNKS